MILNFKNKTRLLSGKIWSSIWDNNRMSSFIILGEKYIFTYYLIIINHYYPIIKKVKWEQYEFLK